MKTTEETQELLRLIISETNATLTKDEDDENFLIVTSWKEVAKINKELNKQLRPNEYYKWLITYYNQQGDDAFENMRLEEVLTTGEKRHFMPDGLLDLGTIVSYGFDDEYTTCGDCGRAVDTSPSYYGDKPRYAIIDNDVICGDCMHDNYMEEYIESCVNDYKNAVNTNIISEDELTNLGWMKLEEKYESGLYQGQNDKPIDVFNKLKKEFDVLFTYEPSQFDIVFWAWVKKVD